jgi:hypothetical protein
MIQMDITKQICSIFSSTACVFIGLVSPVLAGESLGDQGSFEKWSKVEVIFSGPTLQGAGDPNPFDIDLDVQFIGPSGQTFSVPGFYDGDGSGSIDGNVWKVRFSADEEGEWSFKSTSSNENLNNSTGVFTVTPPPPDAPDFYRWGRLEYVGTSTDSIRYLKFRDGPYWLKAGSDDPENFLGSFTNYDTNSERKQAVDYLAERGINSQYLMTHNIDGDDRDVWPWLGATATEAKTNGANSARFDVEKLEEWRDLFEHMQRRGVAVYMILEDDSAWSGYDHDRYYRELIARFGYLPALLFNVGEEAQENYTLSEALELAQKIKDIDPFDHPIGIHTFSTPTDQYVDATQVDFTAIQTNSDGGGEKHNSIAIEWISLSKSRNRRILSVGFDEPRPLMDRRGWWSAYIGGGVWEVHVDQPYDRPVATWTVAWTQLGGARAFMETMPFWQMEPRNDLILSGNAFCLARPGDVYAVYLPSGGTVSLDLPADSDTYEFGWWDPANGFQGDFSETGVIDAGVQEFTPPSSGDWALRIVATEKSVPKRPNPPTDLSSN